MKTYLIKLKPRGHFITPVQADTVFGHLCWLIKWLEGDEALKALLNDFDVNPPFILSDGFPGDFLPAPFHLPTLDRSARAEDAFRQKKALKAIKWLTLDEMNTIRQGNAIQSPIDQRNGFKEFSTLHCSINRISGTTGAEGSLFELEEYAPEDGCEYTSIYALISRGWEEKLKTLFRTLSLTGYGRKRSVGKGAFDILSFEPFNGFSAIAGSNAFISLSNFVPSMGDPLDGVYRVFVKYGKLGGEFAFSEKPFKKPIMMLKAGSVFKCDKPGPFYGRMVKGLCDTYDIVHYGYTFALHCRVN